MDFNNVALLTVAKLYREIVQHAWKDLHYWLIFALQLIADNIIIKDFVYNVKLVFIWIQLNLYAYEKNVYKILEKVVLNVNLDFILITQPLKHKVFADHSIAKQLYMWTEKI